MDTSDHYRLRATTAKLSLDDRHWSLPPLRSLIDFTVLTTTAAVLVDTKQANACICSVATVPDRDQPNSSSSKMVRSSLTVRLLADRYRALTTLPMHTHRVLASTDYRRSGAGRAVFAFH